MYRAYHRRLIENGYKIVRVGSDLFKDCCTFICQLGHETTDIENNINLRERRANKGNINYSEVCPICKFEKRRIDLEKEINDYGYMLISKIDSKFRVRGNGSVEIRCKNGHIEKRKLEHIREYPTCSKCRLSANGWFEITKSLGIPVVEKIAINKARLLLNSGLVEKTISQICTDYMKDPFELYGYTKGELQKKHSRSERSKYLATCSQGHQFSTSTRFLLEGHGCRLCSLSQLNEPEKVIGSWIEDMGIPIIRRDSSIIGEEMDIYVPSRKIGIEYCGIRWHSIENARQGSNPEKNDKFKYKHQKKTLLARDHDIHLITIFESDYLHNREYVKDRVLDALIDTVPPTDDLRYRKLLPNDRYSEPVPLYFDRSYRQVEDEDFAKYTVYDCGRLINDEK